MPKSETFVVTAELQELLDKLPEDQARSRLEPFRAFIMRWRREGRSYESIRLILLEKCHLRTTKSTIFEFVERRSRQRKSDHANPTEEASLPQPPSDAVSSAKKLTAEERAAQIEFIRNLNQPTLDEKPKSGWNFDLDKPRTIQKL